MTAALLLHVAYDKIVRKVSSGSWNWEVAIEIAATKIKACGQMNCLWRKDCMEGGLKSD